MNTDDNYGEPMRDPIWYPYAQMKTMTPPLEVVAAEGVYLQLADGRRLIDAIASWWCVIHGYSHPELVEAAICQTEKLGHVMLGGLTHQPARQLAGKLVEITPEGLSHVFFGDSGSVGVEIALKMAAQYWWNRGQRRKSRFVALEKAYHGDTTGCMSVCDPAEGMHSIFSGIVPQQLFAPAPGGGPVGEEPALGRSLAGLEEILAAHHDTAAGLIVEPLLQAAGGFNMYSPGYLKEARRLCDRHNVLLIFDEVATGFGRTGSMFAADRADVTPDIMVLGKGLTGGMTGHSATLATDTVFDAFYSDDQSREFMHGPTFMANPTACAIALKSIELLYREKRLEQVRGIELVLERELPRIKSSKILDIRVLGATGVVEVGDAGDYSGLTGYAAERGVWIRPFDRFVYIMPPFVITEEELHKVISVLVDYFLDHDK